MSVRKLAVLSMLVVMLIAFNIPASSALGIGAAGATAISSTSVSATGFGAFGGFGFPFNWGFLPYGVGCFPFNWGLGGGWGPFPLLGWNRFSPGFFGLNGRFPFSPGLGWGGCGVCQPLPFILGTECGGPPVLGWDVSPWAFGLQSCVRSLPLYFGAHGFGFPKSLGNWRFGLIPCCDAPCPIPACLPAAPCAPALPAITGGIPKAANAAGGVAKTAVAASIPFILGSECGGPPVLGWDVSPWAFGLQSCVRSLPLYFGAHGFGFPMSLGNYRIGLTPSCCC